MWEILLFIFGALLSLVYFSMAVLSLVYGFPKAVIWAIRGRCRWSAPLRYLLSAVVWTIAMTVAFTLLAIFAPSTFEYIRQSGGFAIGSLIGFWGSALRVLFARSAWTDLRLDFEDFVRYPNTEKEPRP